MTFEESLEIAYKEGWLDNENELPQCFTAIRRYETFYNCDICPLNIYCENESEKIENEK